MRVITNGVPRGAWRHDMHASQFHPKCKRLARHRVQSSPLLCPQFRHELAPLSSGVCDACASHLHHTALRGVVASAEPGALAASCHRRAALTSLPPLSAAATKPALDRRSLQEIYACLGEANSVAQEALGNIRTVRTFSSEPTEIKRFAETMQNARKRDAVATQGNTPQVRGEHTERTQARHQGCDRRSRRRRAE